MLQRIGSLLPEKFRPAISRPISSYADTDFEDPATKKMQCDCTSNKGRVLTEFREGTSTLNFDIQGQVYATVTFGVATHTYIALLFECLDCEGEIRVTCDFGPVSKDDFVGKSNWDFGKISESLTETIVEEIKGLMYDDVYDAFKATENEFPMYNLIKSNCKHWAANFSKRVHALCNKNN